MTACCEFGWQGFNAQWYADRTTGKAAAMTAGNRPANTHKYAGAAAAIWGNDDNDSRTIDA